MYVILGQKGRNLIKLFIWLVKTKKVKNDLLLSYYKLVER